MKKSNSSQGNINQSHQRVFLVLNLLCQSSVPLSAAEISNALNLNRTTTYGLLDSLEALDFLQKDLVTSRYSLTPQLFEMGVSYIKHHRIVQLAENTMREVAQKFGFTVNVGVLRNNSCVLPLATFTGSTEAASILTAGRRLPIYATGMGKLFLADMNESVARTLLESLDRPSYTQYTITDVDLLMPILASIRQDGYATDEREFLDNSGCLSFPIRDANGQIIAAISLSGPYKEITEMREHIIPDMLTRSKLLSSLIGYAPDSF